MRELIDKGEVLSLPRNTVKSLSGELLEETIDVKLIKAMPPVKPEIIEEKTVIVQVPSVEKISRVIVCEEEGIWCKQFYEDQKPETASAQPHAGRWTEDGTCPFCGFEPWYEGDIHTLSYCPNCGSDLREARMDPRE